MKIPTEFQLGGHTINVIWTKDLLKEWDRVGEAAFRFDEIRLQKSTEGYEMAESNLGQSFCHELVHWILNLMGQDELGRDETFIKLFATFLYQYFASAKYGDEYGTE